MPPHPHPGPGAPSRPLRVAVIGAGWAGMAAAVRAVQAGHAVTVFEAARQVGGRARAVPLTLPDGRQVSVDNGQHILIGAYTECLTLMRTVGIDPAQALLRLPLRLQYPDGSGLRLPGAAYLPAPLDAATGILRARGWPWHARLALLRRALQWQRSGFACPPQTSVADLCHGLPPRLLADFFEPLCISALNTPMSLASGQVFLRVLRDALFSQRGGSNLLLPRIDLGALWPEAAARYISQRGAAVRLGQRVQSLHAAPGNAAPGALHWLVHGQPFDRVILATPAFQAPQIFWEETAAIARQTGAEGSKTIANQVPKPATAASQPDPGRLAREIAQWQHCAAALQHRAITTVYAQAAQPVRLHAPMLALHCSAHAPAQFVFDRDAITATAQPTGLLAFVISDSQGSRDSLQAAITAQAHTQLGLRVAPLLTVTEKRATFACTPGLTRPAMHIAPHLLACGDHVQGPYPATLEGAVRSGLQAADALLSPPPSCTGHAGCIAAAAL